LRLSSFNTRYWLRRVDHAGNGILLRGKPYISNRGSMEIGDHVFINSSPVQTHLISASGSRLAIGSRVSIGHGAAIASQCEIEIGEDTRISAYVIIMDSDYHTPGKRFGGNPKKSPVYIGPRSRIGAHSILLRGTVLGAGAEVGPGSVVSGRIAAGEYVQGNPAKVLDQKAVVAKVSGSKDEIVEIAAQTLGLDEAVFHPDQALQALPEWDSLNILRLLLTLEERLGIRLNENQLFSATRVSEILAIVEGAKMDSNSE
jgi:acetyltransferase-like isoleucine patch superfamily enzyme/acyl carrier protein